MQIVNRLKRRLEILEENKNIFCIVEYLPFAEVQKLAENELYKLSSIKPIRGTVSGMIANNGLFRRIVSGGTVKDLDKILAYNLRDIECNL